MNPIPMVLRSCFNWITRSVYSGTPIKVLEYLVYIALMIFLLINNSTFILGTLLV